MSFKGLDELPPEVPPELPEPVPDQDPLRAIYPCRYGCGFSGRPQELSAHYRRDHRGDRQPIGDDRDVGGAPSRPSLEEDPRDAEFRDLAKQVKVLELQRQQLDKEQRIRRLDPGFGGRALSTEDPDIAFLNSLRKKELLEAEVDKTRAQAEAYRNPWPAPPAADAEVGKLRDELAKMKEQMQDQRFEFLKNSLETSIQGLRSELKNNQSELKTMIVEAADLAKTWIASPGPAAQIAAAKLGFKAVVVEDFPPAAPEGARNGVVEGLKPHGFVARIVEKESASS